MSRLTKQALADSLKKLMETHTLKSITVKDLVEECGVNRQTFYYHFQDIYDLLRWIFETEAEKVLGQNKNSDNWSQGFLNAFHYVLDNRKFVEHAYASLGKEHLERYLHKVVYTLLLQVIEEQSQGLDVSEDSKSYIAHFYKYAFVGIALDWIGNGMKTEPEVIIHKLTTLLEGDFRRGLIKLNE